MSNEQINNPLPCAVFFTEAKVGKTGLTVTVDVYRWDGATWTQIITDGAATPVGGGWYSYNLASGGVTVEGLYAYTFKTVTTSVDQQHIPAGWPVGKAGVENLNAAINSRLATASYTAPDNANILVSAVGVTTLLGRITATLFTGITSFAGWLRILTRKDAAATTDYAASLTEINANGGSGAGGFTNLSESLEAIAETSAAGTNLVINSDAPVLQTLSSTGKLTIHRGDYTTFDLTLGSLVGRTGKKLIFTIKPVKDDRNDDTLCYLQITEVDGAVLVNGSSGGVVASDASMTVLDESTGLTRFVIKNAITDVLPIKTSAWYDTQMIDAAGQPRTKAENHVNITRDVTRRAS